MKLLVGLAVLLISLAHGAAPSQPAQHRQLLQACDRGASALGHVVAEAATVQIATVHVPLRVIAPGTVTGRMAFNPSGQTIGVGSGEPPPPGFSCGSGAGSSGVPTGPGHSRLVSTLRRTFTRVGRFTLTFELNAAGRRILARLGAADRAYRQRHPHGGQPPSITYGVGLSYTPAG
jgi:hypothetical protein